MNIKTLKNITGGLVKSTVMGVAFLMMLSGCVTRYNPQTSEYVSVTNGHAIVEIDDVQLVVAHRRWTAEPTKINDFFTTYHVTVKNSGSGKVAILPEDITLLDEERNQYDVWLFEDVGDAIFREDARWEKFGPILERDREWQPRNDQMQARASLMQNSFHYGEIRPNARKTGYIFFSRLSPRNRKTTFIFRDKEIEFVRE